MVRSCSFKLLCLLPIVLASCVQTPKEKLLGRWYNEANSIRFNADGTLFWNAKQGQATGNYVYTGAQRAAVSGSANYNLKLDLVTNGRVIQTTYEAEFLGDGHLRLLQTDDGRANAPKRILVLKRAAIDSNQTADSSLGDQQRAPARRRSRAPTTTNAAR